MKILSNPFTRFIFLSTFISSCSGSGDDLNSSNRPSSAESDSTQVLIDSVQVDSSIVSHDYDYLFEKANEVRSIPFKLDSVYITENATKFEEDAINGDDVRLLAAELLDHDLTFGAKFNIAQFLDIDSLKANGDYEEYLNSLDIGMTARSDAFIMDVVEISETEKILLWYITYSTYEACPYGAGTFVFGTYFVNGNYGNTALLGEDSGGGDPPYWGNTLVESEISATGYWSERINRSGGDEDEEGNEIIEFDSEIYDLEFFEGKIVHTGL